MPIYPGGPRFGLGLWNTIPGTLLVEVALYAVGLWLHVRTPEARDAIGRWVFIALAVFLLVGYMAAIGTVPPSIPALIIPALAGGAVLIVWSWWVDTHRSSNDVVLGPLVNGKRLPDNQR